MSKDKYASIFSLQMEAIALSILQIFFATRAVLIIGEYKNNSRHLARKYVWVFDQVRGRDGWILAEFFFVCLNRDGVEVHKLAKKERGQYPAILTEQTWSIKDLLYGFRGNFACWIQRVVPRGQDGSILPARVANHSARYGSSCPLVELGI